MWQKLKILEQTRQSTYGGKGREHTTIRTPNMIFFPSLSPWYYIALWYSPRYWQPLLCRSTHGTKTTEVILEKMCSGSVYVELQHWKERDVTLSWSRRNIPGMLAKVGEPVAWFQWIAKTPGEFHDFLSRTPTPVGLPIRFSIKILPIP